MPVTTRAIRSTREEKRTSRVYWRSAQRSNSASSGPDARAYSMAPRAITLTGLCSQKRSKIGPSSMAAPSGRMPYPGHWKELTTSPAHIGSPALDTELTDDQRQYLTTVKSAADALLGIINDILDFAKIESGRLELDPAEFSLLSALGATLRALAVRAHKKGLELVCQQQPDVPDALIGDAGRLRQVLLNLVGNAVKFTERGEVVVTVGLQNADCRLQIENAGQEQSSANLQSAICNLKFEVRDTGIGIPPEKQAKIFRAFEQEDTS